MTSVSITPAENATKKRSKVHRSRQERACKIIAFQQLTSLKQSQISERQAAALLEVPFSTMQSWQTQENRQEIEPELTEFISTPIGQKFLNRLVNAAHMAIRYSHGGIRGLQEFLQLSKLDNFVASSEGALHAFVVRSEKHMLAFGASQEMLLVQSLKQRKITVALDEMFRGRHPCLVAIEIVSGYILLEKFTDDRSAATWVKELKPKLAKLDVQLDQVVSDLCGGIRACAKELGAVHSPDIFHSQQEITKATSAPLASQEESFKTALDDAEKKLEKAIKKHGENSEKSKQARGVRNLRRMGYEARKERRNKVRVAKKELGRAHHPINLQTGKLQTSNNVKDMFHKQLTIIEECAKEADLSTSCMKRLAKAGRAFNAIWEYMAYFLAFFVAYIRDLKLTPKQELFFQDVVFPLSYLYMIWRRLSKKEREELQPLRVRLEKEFEEGQYSKGEKAEWMVKGEECAKKFQRSTSCVEGRNGVLSLYHHRFCRLNQRSYQALTVIHNFHLKRSDGRTAAMRFFDSEHENLFESLVMNVCIPGMPKKQSHCISKKQANDLEKGQVGCVVDKEILAA
jgi:Family of unknown function (DUF6399)